jgi:hypothetical protein
MQSSGARFVRTTLNWNEIEKKPGQYDWTAADRTMKALKAAGMTPLLIVSNAPFPGVYTPGAAICGPLTPAGLAGFEAFLKAAMFRYGANGTIPDLKGSARYWQIYNEADFYIKNLSAPDGDLGALGGGCLGNTTNPYGGGESFWGPKLYAAVLGRAKAAKLAADPDAKIVLAALASDGCYDRDLNPVDDPAKNAFNCLFFPQLIDPTIGAAGDLFDLAAFNSYMFYRANHEKPGAKGFLGKIERFRGYMRKAGLVKPIAIVETGLAYGQGTNPCPNFAGKVLSCVDFTPDDPATLVAPVLAWTLQAHSAAIAPVNMVIWFAMSTDAPTSAGDWGLVYQGKPTQAYQAYQHFVR